MRTPGPMHKEALALFKRELEDQGYQVVLLNGKSPDGVAISPQGQLVAVECIGESWRPGGWNKSSTVTAKKRQYGMFDEVLIRVFRFPSPDDPIVKCSCGIEMRRSRGIPVPVGEKVELLCVKCARKHKVRND